jgi:two-component system sensor histidine kinase QseC
MSKSFLLLFFKKEGLLPSLSSLRIRLAAAMLCVLAAALTASAFLGDASAVPAGREPYQDAAVLGLFTTAVIGLVWFVSLWSLRPLARAAREAARIGPDQPAARISLARIPTEIQPLVTSVNQALDRMADAYEAERRFTANAAHELRTPLSVLSLRLQRAQAAEDPAAADWPGIADDVRQMTRLVNQLLDLARKEQAGRADPATAQPLLNLSRIAREAAAAALPLAEAAGRSVHVDLPDDLPIRGRPDDLRDMVLNVLDNAIKHGGGAITLSATRLAGRAVLDVADEGPGVPAALRDAVFGRFRKGAADSGGSGLGLAIVREVAASHAGTAAFLPGEASVLRIDLPLALRP